MTGTIMLQAKQFTQADLDRAQALGAVEGSYWTITGTCLLSAATLFYREVVTFLHLNTLGFTPASQDELWRMGKIVGFGLLVMGFQILRLKRLNRRHASLSAEIGADDGYVALDSRKALHGKLAGMTHRLRQILTKGV